MTVEDGAKMTAECPFGEGKISLGLELSIDQKRKNLIKTLDFLINVGEYLKSPEAKDFPISYQHFKNGYEDLRKEARNLSKEIAMPIKPMPRL